MRGLARLRRELARFAARHEGLLLEDKGATLALHYRLVPGLAAHVHRTLRAMLQTMAVSAEWRLQPGKGILEIKPDGRDKGTAMLEYMAEPPFAGRLPVFVGDDLTDEYGFVAVVPPRRMGGEGRPRADAGALPAARRRCRPHVARRGTAAGGAVQDASPLMRNLDLALIGNGAIGLLVDAAGVGRLGMLSRASTATRRSARCSTTRRPARSAASGRSISSTAPAPSSRTSRTRRCSSTRLFDSARRRRRDHRLRAALRPARPPLPSDVARPARPAARRAARASWCACGPPSTTAAIGRRGPSAAATSAT